MMHTAPQWGSNDPYEHRFMFAIRIMERMKMSATAIDKSIRAFEREQWNCDVQIVQAKYKEFRTK